MNFSKSGLSKKTNGDDGNPSRFWMVLANKAVTSKPSVKHPSFEEAQAEALRLCNKDKCEFFVLECVGSAKVGEAEWEGV